MPIQVKNVSFIYNKDSAFQKKALENIDLTIADGEFIGLIGHTGSGKSTLIQHLNALLKPDSGEVLLDNDNINADKSKLKSVRCKVGLVFQYPEHQLFEMTVYKDVAFGPENMGLPKEDVDSRVKKALDIVGIAEEIFEKSPFELSGGQKRRVAIAGVLAMEPKVLILDEPTAGLDPRGRDEILNQIKEMHRKLGITVILVSHSMEDIARLVDRIIVMSKGKIVMDDIPGEIFKRSSELESMGLAAPQSSYLIKALREKGFDVSENVYNIDDAVEEIYKLLTAK